MSKRQITLGTWDGNPIQWIVLKEQDGKALCISKNILFSHCFNPNDSDGHHWSGSDIRKYLNYDFFDKAFTVDEKKKIVNSKIQEKVEDLQYMTKQVNWSWCDVTIPQTKDNIFLLTAREANDFMTQNERNVGSWWWLRSPYADNDIYAWRIYSDGSFRNDTVRYGGGIRPALYLKS